MRLGRVLLPDDDDDRMPPFGETKRPRLTAEETASLDALAAKVAGDRYDERGMTLVNA